MRITEVMILPIDVQTSPLHFELMIYTYFVQQMCTLFLPEAHVFFPIPG